MGIRTRNPEWALFLFSQRTNYILNWLPGTFSICPLSIDGVPDINNRRAGPSRLTAATIRHLFYSSVLVGVNNHFILELVKLGKIKYKDNNERELFFPHTCGMMHQSNSARVTSYLEQESRSLLVVIPGISTRFKAQIELRWCVAQLLEYFDSFVNMVL